MNKHDDLDIQDEKIRQMVELGEELLDHLQESNSQSPPRGPAGVDNVENALLFLEQIERIPPELGVTQYHKFSDVSTVLYQTHDLRLVLKLIEVTFDDSDFPTREGFLPLFKECDADAEIRQVIRTLFDRHPSDKLDWACALAEWFPDSENADDLLRICVNDELDPDCQDRAFSALEGLVDTSGDPALGQRVEDLRQTRFPHLA